MIRAQGLGTGQLYDNNLVAPLRIEAGTLLVAAAITGGDVLVKGAIVIARYGGSWRGIKPKVAGEHGAVGCLIYSDPRNDGFAGGSVFPAGECKPANAENRDKGAASGHCA